MYNNVLNACFHKESKILEIELLSQQHFASGPGAFCYLASIITARARTYLYN